MSNKIVLYLSLFFVSFLICFSKENSNGAISNVDQISFVQEDPSYFELSYTTAGLGSNMGSLMPKYVLKGEKFTYVLSQNSSFNGKFDTPSELLCEGKVRKSSFDSIISLIQFIPDSEIYNTNAHIMSGVYQMLLIKTETKKIRFDLHNGFDTTAAQVIKILNSNLPDGQRKLTVFGSSPDRRD